MRTGQYPAATSHEKTERGRDEDERAVVLSFHVKPDRPFPQNEVDHGLVRALARDADPPLPPFGPSRQTTHNRCASHVETIFRWFWLIEFFWSDLHLLHKSCGCRSLVTAHPVA